MQADRHASAVAKGFRDLVSALQGKPSKGEARRGSPCNCCPPSSPRYADRITGLHLLLLVTSFLNCLTGTFRSVAQTSFLDGGESVSVLLP